MCVACARARGGAQAAECAIWSPEMAATFAGAKLRGGARCQVVPRQEEEGEGRRDAGLLTWSAEDRTARSGRAWTRRIGAAAGLGEDGHGAAAIRRWTAQWTARRRTARRRDGAEMDG